ncbi:MAG: hypothetical protein Q4B14_02115 [Clostridia bacterium]|nr:hypothetical protein [Clostridia bacterium]
MIYNNLANEYMKQSNEIKGHIKNLKLDLKDSTFSQKRDLKRRIAMLYEISYEMNCVANRLKGGYSDDYKLYC